MQVARGDTVQWRNASRNPQTVTDDPARVSDKSKIALPSGAEPFDSGVINPGDSFTHAFTVAGDYQYVSLPFESQNMIGRVMVRN
jgi:plastocyanin